MKVLNAGPWQENTKEARIKEWCLALQKYLYSRKFTLPFTVLWYIYCLCIWSQVGITLTYKLLFRNRKHRLSSCRVPNSVLSVQLILTQWPLLSVRSIRVGEVYSSNWTPPPPTASPGLLMGDQETVSQGEHVSVPWARWHGSMSGDECVHTHGHWHKRPPPQEMTTDV